MKSLFPYLVMIVLFLAGTRLVNRQQTYIRSIQESSVADTTAFTSMLVTSEAQLQPTINTGLTDQQGSIKSTNAKKRANSVVR